MEEERALQRKAEGSPDAADEDAARLVNETVGSPGRPLDERTRRQFEPMFGHSFSDERVHDDARANASAQPSLGVSSPHDPAEAEADRAADAVASARKPPPVTAAAPATGALVQRQSAAEVAAWALGGAGALFADDATVVGVLDDPLAIALLGVAAVAGGIALADALTSPSTADVSDEADEETTTTSTTDVTTDVTTDTDTRRRNSCFQQNPTAIPCENADFGIEEIVVEFLLNEGFSWDDLGSCTGFSSFGAGTIDACDGAPGQSWHCNVAGSPDPVSIFGCLCCRPDGSTGFEWRRPHWSTYLGRRSGR